MESVIVIYLPEPDSIDNLELNGDEMEDLFLEQRAIAQEEELMAKIEANDALVAEMIADVPLMEQEGDCIEIEKDEDDVDVGYRECDLF